MTIEQDESSTPPEVVVALLGAASERISAAIGVAPDLTQDTLPLLDGYLRMVADELDSDERHAALAELGCHFGEVTRRLLNGRWAATDEATDLWRIELASCFLYFHPISMTAEVMLGVESEDYDGTFATSDELHDQLQEMLASAAPMSEEAYFSLCGRIDILLLVADFLTGRRLIEAKGKRPDDVSAEDYLQVVEGRS